MESSISPAADPEAGLQSPTGQARVVEVFSSIQGEGPHVGRRHIFVRFFACNLRCLYCDTPESLTGNPDARIETEAGTRDFATVANPLVLEQLSRAVEVLARSPHDAVALTGGEPLLQSEAIARLAPVVREMGLRVYLETNGTLPDKLAAVVSHVDTVAMDLKLPGTLSGRRDCLPEHREFLRVAMAAPEVFCKLVLPPDPDWLEFERAVRMVAGVSRSVALIVQPVTPFGEIGSAPDHSTILRAFGTARHHLDDVRVVPQTHKMMGLL